MRRTYKLHQQSVGWAVGQGEGRRPLAAKEPECCTNLNTATIKKGQKVGAGVGVRKNHAEVDPCDERPMISPPKKKKTSRPLVVCGPTLRTTPNLESSESRSHPGPAFRHPRGRGGPTRFPVPRASGSHGSNEGVMPGTPNTTRNQMVVPIWQSGCLGFQVALVHMNHNRIIIYIYIKGHIEVLRIQVR